MMKIYYHLWFLSLLAFLTNALLESDYGWYLAHEGNNVTIAFDLNEGWTRLELYHDSTKVYFSNRALFEPHSSSILQFEETNHGVSFTIPQVEMIDAGNYYLKTDNQETRMKTLIVRAKAEFIIDFNIPLNILNCCIKSTEAQSYVGLSQGKTINRYGENSMMKNNSLSEISINQACLVYDISVEEMSGNATFQCIFQHFDKKEQPIIKARVYEFDNPSMDEYPKTATLTTEVPPTNDHEIDNSLIPTIFAGALSAALSAILLICVAWLLLRQWNKRSTNKETSDESSPLSSNNEDLKPAPPKYADD